MNGIYYKKKYEGQNNNINKIPKRITELKIKIIRQMTIFTQYTNKIEMRNKYHDKW